MPELSSGKAHSPSGSPWVYFFILLAANTSLSYLTLPLGIKLGIGLSGIALPFGFLFWKNAPAPGETFSPASGKFLPSIPIWAFLLLFLAALGIRLAQLTTLSSWPLVDEGIAGYFATEISETGKLHFFYSYAQWPPLFVWTLGLFFKFFGPSLASLWLFPALLSAFSVPLAYAAARAFFPRSFAFLFSCFWAFSFPSLYLGRLCQGQSLEVLWQLAVFALLGAMLGQTNPLRRKTMAALLGFITGTGFYTLHHWPVMALFVILAVFGITVRDFQKQKTVGLAFLAFFLSTSIPYLALLSAAGQGGYLKSVFAFHADFSWEAQAHTAAEYIGGLFWGVQTDRYAYKPFWGGFLNPLAASLFFLELPFLLRAFRGRLEGSILLGLGLFSLPALLCNDLELMRWLLVFPLLGVVCTRGLCRLFPGAGTRRTGLAGLAILLLLTSGLDIYHLWGPYQRAWHSNTQAVILESKSMERLRAYQLLSSMERAQGPGLIFTELETTPFDQTLATAVYPFNAARNPRLLGVEARWAGLVTNINFAPFLAKRYPEGRWFPLIAGDASPPGGLVLGIIPITARNQKGLEGWGEAEKALRPVTASLFHLPFGQAPRETLRMLLQLEPSVRPDPFLESCVAEKIFYSALSCSEIPPAQEALQRALVQGYPSANLFNDLGVLWWTAGDRAKAVLAFQAALRSPVNHTAAADNLRAIQ